MLTFFSVLLMAANVSLAASDELGDAVRTAIRQVSPSVVRIQIIGVPDRSGTVASRTTTGVVVTDQGEIISSSFGFGGQIAGLFVEDSTGQRCAAEVVAQDHLRKLVLLRCDADRLPVPKWSEETPQVGAWSIAAGRFYPTQMPSASLGVISALKRVHGMAIQTDAKISPVNYGGPLIGMDGQVFGILVPLAPGNESIGVSAGVQWYDSGIGFAIPAAGVLESVEILRTGKDRYQGLLGIQMHTNNPLSETLRVAEVIPDSPAALAGLQSDDIIMAAAGVPMARVGMLESMMKRAAAGDTLTFKVQRGSEQLDISATLTQTLSIAKPGWIGIVPIFSVAPDDANEDGPASGVRCGIIANSPAANAGVPPTVVITKVNDDEVTSSGQLRTIFRQIKAGSDWTLECFAVDTPSEPRTFHLTAVPKEQGTLEDLQDAIGAIRSSSVVETPDTKWQATSSDLTDDTHLWLLAPAEKQTGAETGVVILLQNDPPVFELLKRSWQEVCSRDNLILAVVSRDNELPISQSQVLARVMSEASKFGTLDSDRVVLVTESVHAEFVAQAVASPRIGPLRLGVFINSRPVLDRTAIDSIRRKLPSFLFLTADDKLETKALLSTLVTALRSAGADILLADHDPQIQTTPAEIISNWLWTRKIH